MEKQVVAIAKYHISDCDGKHAFTDTKAKRFDYSNSIGEVMKWVKETNSQEFQIITLE